MYTFSLGLYMLDWFPLKYDKTSEIISLKRRKFSLAQDFRAYSSRLAQLYYVLYLYSDWFTQ